MRKIRKRELNGNINKGIIALIPITAMGLMTSCNNIALEKQYEYTRLQFTNDGIYRESKQYESFNMSDKKDEFGKLTCFARWKQNRDGKYSRKVREFDISNKTLEEIKALVYSEQEPEEVLGKPAKEYEQISSTLTRKEIERYDYREAVIYDKNEQKYVMIKNPKRDMSILIVGSIAMVSGIAVAIAWKKYDDMISDKKEKKLTLKKRDN